MTILQQNAQLFLSKDSSTPLFLAIVSIHNSSILGYKLCPYNNSDNNDYSDSYQNKVQILDNLLYNFSLLKNIDKLIFINLNISSIDKGPLGISEAILTLSSIIKSAKKHGINHENIVIEILDSKLKNVDALSELIEIYRRHGFIIALDEFGIGYSNLDRIAILKPDIVKVDSSLIKNIEQCYHKQEIFKAITGLARKIGTVVIANRIETKEEAVKSLELRADFLQGDIFSNPNDNSLIYIQNKINSIYSEFKNQMLFNLEVKQNRTTFLQNKVDLIKSMLEDSSHLEQTLYKIVYSNHFIEAVYLLDYTGRQISSTVISPYAKCSHSKALFSPALKDSDHSLKLYYNKIKTGESDFHITEPYISNATGNRCSTISTVTDNNLILCIDISELTDDNQFNTNAG